MKIDIEGLIKEFNTLEIETTFRVNSELDYTFIIISTDISSEELAIINKYGKIDGIKMDQDWQVIEILLKELDTKKD